MGDFIRPMAYGLGVSNAWFANVWIWGGVDPQAALVRSNGDLGGLRKKDVSGWRRTNILVASSLACYKIDPRTFLPLDSSWTCATGGPNALLIFHQHTEC